ncbi:MAG: stage II sporulation protein E [Novibacillus thermophilus]
MKIIPLRQSLHERWRQLDSQLSVRRTFRQLQNLVVGRWNILLLLMGFLLGRAVLLEQVSPFALPFLAVVYHLKRDRWAAVAVALLIGQSTTPNGQAVWMLATFLLYIVLQKGADRWLKRDLNYTPLIVLTTLLLTQGIRLGAGGCSLYGGMLALIEMVLSVLLTFIFVQSLPVFTSRKRRNVSLKGEELVCLAILLASVMTGMVGWTYGDMSVEHIFSRYVILLFALVGGGMLGTTVGVVTGMILSLSNQQAVLEISLLAFSGLLAGLFREGKKWGVATGFLIGTSILALYTSPSVGLWTSLQESLAAVLLLLLTPAALTTALARFVPGTNENERSQQEYSRRVRDMTAKKVEQFSHVFSQLSRSFSSHFQHPEQEEEYLQRFVTELSDSVCAGCRKYEECWGTKFYQTYNGITDLVALVELADNKGKIQTPRSWKDHCVKSKDMVALIRDKYETYQRDLAWQERLRETQQIVSEQLSGMSKVMMDWAFDIRRETQVLTTQEEQIQQALEDLGLSIHRVDVMSLEEGNVEIEVTLPHDDDLESCRKIIAPLLTDIVGEHITVYEKEGPLSENGGLTTITFGSAQNYEVKAGVAKAAKGGRWLSGDSYSYTNLGTGKYAVAISDGMGNGPRAQEESQAALKMLEQLLLAGMEELTAVKTVNAILGMRKTDEVYATVDLALVDLDTARTTFLKIGSTPSFIKRGNDVIPVTASNLPIGILKDIDVDTVTERLMPGDMLIMMTDGVFDAPRQAANKEAWMKRAIHEIRIRDPQAFADLLLEKVVRERGGHIDDDMTVVVTKVDHSIPNWATISIPGMPRIRRKEALSN